MSSRPITAPGLEGRYALALFELALEKKALDPVAKDVAAIARLIEKSPDFAHLIRNPLLDEATQAKAVEAIAKKAKFHVLTRHFLGVLAENRRLSALSRITRSFSRIVAEHKGEITAEVTSAEQLSKAQQKALKAKLEKSLGQDISFQTRVDKSLLGGLVVKVGSKLIDDSLKTKLSSLRLKMKGA